MKNILPIDMGAGYIQAIINGKRIKFASIVGNYQPSNSGLISGNQDLSIQVEDLGEWNFGSTATLQSSGGGSRRHGSNRIFTPEYLGSMLLAISEGYSPNTREIEVDIITGLPGTEYNRGKEYKAKFRKFIVGQYKIHRSGYSQQITIKSIRWTNQAWGAIWQHLIDEKGNPIRPDIKADKVLIGCINVGYRTIEIGTVEVSGIQSGTLRVQPAAGIELSEPDGVHRLIERFTAALSTTFERSFRTEQAIEILENDGLVIDGTWKSYHLLNELRDTYNSIIYNHMTKVYDNGTSFLYRLINTGGGANITKDVFSDIPQLVVSNKPQWDTVAGYGVLAKYIAKRNK